jgi:hypothetical protein
MIYCDSLVALVGDRQLTGRHQMRFASYVRMAYDSASNNGARLYEVSDWILSRPLVDITLIIRHRHRAEPNGWLAETLCNGATEIKRWCSSTFSANRRLCGRRITALGLSLDTRENTAFYYQIVVSEVRRSEEALANRRIPDSMTSLDPTTARTATSETCRSERITRIRKGWR